MFAALRTTLLTTGDRRGRPPLRDRRLNRFRAKAQEPSPRHRWLHHQLQLSPPQSQPLVLQLQLMMT